MPEKQTAAAAAQQPVFNIQRIYLKELSLEQPNSPKIFLEQAQPQVSIELALATETVAEGIYELVVTATVHAKLGERTVFLVEGKQAGIFEVRHLPQEQLGTVLGVACPQIVYPYLRANVADVITRAGFPPVHLAEINFQAMYEARRAQAANGAAPVTNGAPPAPANA